MIYVATVHFGSARWIAPQAEYLERTMSEEYRVFACLEGVEGDHAARFARVVPARGAHSGKLNLLAAEIAAEARPDDIVLFLDGDAFPVRDPMPTVHAALADTALVAVRRDENVTDRQPHPCFCAVRVRDWQRLHGDWSPGHCWVAADGRTVTDVGGNLLRALERTGTAWTPLLRSNRVNPHPLWYGVYAGVVYHHGAGFRPPVGRVDLLRSPGASPLGRRVPVVGDVLRRWDSARRQRFTARTAASAEQLHDDMYDRLRRDPEFFRALL